MNLNFSPELEQRLLVVAMDVAFEALLQDAMDAKQEEPDDATDGR